MSLIDWLTDHIQMIDIDDIFEEPEEAGWFWINRTVFSDIFFNLGFEVKSSQNEKEIFEELDENEMFDILKKTFKKLGYISMNQFLFSNWDKDFKPTQDMTTLVFVKIELYRKISIYFQNNFGWFLKATALDTYYKINSEFSNVAECYEELYRDNYRIIEEILSNKQHEYFSGKWKYIKKDGVLLFYKGNKFMNSWTEQSAESFYHEMIMEID